jgi:hypothetical protein
MRTTTFLLLLAACRSSDPNDPCSDAGNPALLTLGTRQGDVVVPWTPDDRIPIEFGPQGGSHTYVDIAGTHLEDLRPDLTITVDVEAQFLDTGAEAPAETTYTNPPFRCQAGTALVAERVQIFVTGVGGVWGCSNLASVTATLGDVSTTAEVTLVAPPGCADVTP